MEEEKYSFAWLIFLYGRDEAMEFLRGGVY